MDLTSGKQYALPIWLQLSLIAVARSALQVGALSWTIFFNLHHKFSIALRSGLFAGYDFDLICLSSRKVFSFCSMERCISILKTYVIIPKHPFNRWNKKCPKCQCELVHLLKMKAISQLSLQCLYLTCSPISSMTVEICTFSSGSRLQNCHCNGTKQKFRNYYLAQCRFGFIIENDLHPVIHSQRLLFLSPS